MALLWVLWLAILSVLLVGWLLALPSKGGRLLAESFGEPLMPLLRFALLFKEERLSTECFRESEC